ncbi:MAG: 1-acyl-sn-glycerol-3-phosphate acyltransferase [Spirochaetaceae bacterium]|nr:MAG: 1-acyl-sn-glycerol-3-phosphate acyltransferase [Spirochaetaceae bacterium]
MVGTVRRKNRRKGRRARRRIAASKLFHRFLRATFGNYLTTRYGARSENAEFLRQLRPPYLVLPNHTSVLDPFFVNRFVPGIVHYVVSDSNFRSRIVEFGLALVGAIPKTKAMSDLDTIKNIMAVTRSGGIVGIFPEGQSSWDGATLPMYYSTAKLIKVLKVPVVVARINGAFLTLPRWSKRRRYGKITVRFDLAFDAKGIRAASVDQINERIVTLLDHDDIERNRVVRQRFTGRDRAEYAEIALFMCPSCRAIGSLRSEGNELGCSECGYRVRLSIYGLFQPVRGELRFDTMHGWNLWQTQEFRAVVDRYAQNGADAPLLTEEAADVRIGFRENPLEPFALGRMELYADRITVLDGTEAHEFPIAEIRGINVQNKERLEFYSGEDLFSVSLPDPRGCTYKWDLAVRHLQRNG